MNSDGAVYFQLLLLADGCWQFLLLVSVRMSEVRQNGVDGGVAFLDGSDIVIGAVGRGVVHLQVLKGKSGN